jgi:membrane protease YdiL (CAAX protease family)
MSGDSSSPAPVASKDSYKGLPWGPAAGILVTALAFVLSQVIAGGLVMLGLAALGWSSHHIESWLNGAIGQFLVVTFSESLALGILWLFLRRRKADWRLLGFRRNPAWRDAGYAIAGFVIYFAFLVFAAILASALFHINLDQKQEVGFENVVGTAQKLVTLVSLVVLPPLVEETLFRGFLFGSLRKKLPLLWATLATSLLFAGPHLLESSHGLLWIGGIDTFILSLVLCYLREKTGALWAGIAVHMLKNGIAFLYLYIFVSK